MSRSRRYDPDASDESEEMDTPSTTRCGMTRKVSFSTHEAAMTRAGEILKQPDCDAAFFRSYRCRFCAGWHLTSKTPL